MIMPGVQKPHCRPWFSRKACLHRMQLAVLARPSIVVTFAPSRLHREHRAGLDRAAVDMDGAGAALRRVAADMRAGQAQILAQELHEQGSRIDRGRREPAVYRDREINHSHILLNQDFSIGGAACGAAGADADAGWRRRPSLWRRDRRGRGGRFQRSMRGGVSPHGRLGETGEEFVGHALGDAVDEPGPELGHLAADMRLDVISQEGGAALGVGERHLRPAFGEAGDAALAFAGNGVAELGDDVRELNFAFERGGDRSDLGLDDRGEAVFPGPL